VNFTRLSASTVTVFILLSAVSLWGGAAMAPVLETYGYSSSSASLYVALSSLCHQFPSRSFWFSDAPFALCARCVGGYLGVTLAALMILVRPGMLTEWKRYNLALVGLLMMVPGVSDGLIQLMTSYTSTNDVRVITGLLGGFGFVLLAFPLPFRWTRAATSLEVK